MLSLGCIFGPLLGGYSAKKIGRKPTLLIAALPILVGFVIKAFASNIQVLYAARFLMGLGAGTNYVVLPMYLGEIAEDRNRGAISGTMVTFVALGVLFAYVIGSLTTIQVFSLICVIPLGIFLVAYTLYCPESPIYLALIGSDKRLKISVLKLRNKLENEIDKEIFEINSSVQQTTHKKLEFKNIFGSKSVRRGLMLCVGTTFVQQFSGINPVVSYLQPIFELSAVRLQPELASAIIGAVQIIMTTISSIIVDRLGRKILLLLSATGIYTSLTILGLYLYFNFASLNWLPILCLIIYMMSFNVGLSPIPWTLMGELFAPDIKSVSSTILCVINFAFNFLTLVIFPILIEAIGLAPTFWIFAGLTFLGSIFVWKCLPETKGKSLEEIIELLEK